METTNYGIIWSQNVHLVTTLLVTLMKPNLLTKVVKEYALIQKMSWRPLNMESFGHKIFISSQPYWSLKTKKLIEQKLLWNMRL